MKLAEMKEDFQTRKATWDQEKTAVERVSKLKEEIESLNNEIQIAQRNYDLNKAAELQYGRLPELQKQLLELHQHDEQSAEDADRYRAHRSRYFKTKYKLWFQ